MTLNELNDLIAAARVAHPDDAAAARAVWSGLSSRSRGDALALILPAYMAGLPKPSAGAKGAPRPNDLPPRPKPSSKVALIRDAWASRLDRVEYFADGSRVALRDMTRDQLLEVAAANRHRAAEHVASAERLERIAAAMASTGSRTVGDLPSAAGLSAWRDAA